MALTKNEDFENIQALTALMSERILIVDGATGTALERLNPTAEDFGGEEFYGCNEMLNEHAPHIVMQVHKSYIDAGADIIETNSFNGSQVVLAEYGVAEKSRELARKSAQHAQKAAIEYAGDRKVRVMGSMGPGTKTIAVTGGIAFDEVFAVYKDYALGLLEGGVDLLLLETVQDTLNLKAAYLGVKEALKELDRAAPIALSVTIEMGGTMLAGQNIEALYHTVANFDLFSIGLNCATGPAMMSDHLRTLANLSRFPVSVWPNAGLPDHDGNYSEGPDVFRKVIGRFAAEGFLNLAGGCCGTTAAHIKALREVTTGVKPRVPKSNGFYPSLAGSEPMVVEADNRPVFVGERTNTIGSRKFKRLIGEGKWDEAAEIGRKQVRKSAMVLDLCAADPDRDEAEDFLGVLKPLLRKVRVPILIDTTDIEVVELAFKNIGGKPAVNSVNLEDGGERLRKAAAMAVKYGASLICGLIDDDPEQGMAVTVERKLEIAEKTYRILKDDFDFPDGDIIFDPLVFPAGTGDPNYLGSAEATIEGVKQVKKHYPNCLTVLGISNVSFGLPPAGREALNSVFLYLCSKAGLDMAIVNTQRLMRYPSIPDDDKALAEKLLMKGDKDTITEFTARFRDVKIKSSADDWAGLSTEDKAARAVVEAQHEGLEKNLKELLSRMEPLEVINGPLMTGMDEVGKLFGENKLIVAEVLESAEVMKKAVDVVKPYFPPGASEKVKGKMILATVKGDVHDIGKNLVDMIMSNNGFEIINLGIKIAPETLINAVKEYDPDMIGLSGLLVRSAQQMVATAEDLTAAGIELPLMVGGAALTKKFTLNRIAPAYKGPVFYASEAMEGLNLGNIIIDKNRYPALVKEWKEMAEKTDEKPKKKPQPEKRTDTAVKTDFGWIETDVPQPPDLKEHILKNIPIDTVWGYISLQMLYGKHLGVRKFKQRLKDPNDEKMLDLKDRVDKVIGEASKLDVLEPRAIYRWFKAIPKGEQIIVENPDGEPAVFNFPRQKARDRLCAVDWIRPADEGGDHVGVFVATSGADTGELAKQWRDEGKYLDSLILQSVGIELAEATAEWLHQRMRAEWGIMDPPGVDWDYLFKTRYRGIRLSFGYPACPDLEDQRDLFRILKPERIGVSLTEGLMMFPEGSVSAVAFHHPDGQYYAV